jgi:hypothetical protein
VGLANATPASTPCAFQGYEFFNRYGEKIGRGVGGLRIDQHAVGYKIIPPAPFTQILDRHDTIVSGMRQSVQDLLAKFPPRS